MPPPAERSGPPVATAGPGTAPETAEATPENLGIDPGGRPQRRLRCERCLEVVSTRHAWDSMTCRCGALTVTGPPWAPSVRWTSSPGGGWSEVDDGEPGPAPPAHAAPIGYLRPQG